MSLQIRTNDDLKQMRGYMIEDAETMPAVGGLLLTLSHITEPGVRYKVAVIPNIMPALNGNLLGINRGLIINSTGVVVVENSYGQV